MRATLRMIPICLGLLATSPAGAQGLPGLAEGAYVAVGIACDAAAPAAVMAVRRTGLSSATVPCRFTRIERLGLVTFLVEQSCRSGGAEVAVLTSVLLHPDGELWIKRTSGEVVKLRRCGPLAGP